MRSKVFGIVLGAGLCFGIVGSASAQSVMEAVNDYCKCASPILKQTSEIMNAMNSGDMAQMAALATEMEENSGEMLKCMDELETKYAEAAKDEEFKNKVEAAAEKQCPNPMKAMAEQMQKQMMVR